jgi:protein-tyrosine phosphatase
MMHFGMVARIVAIGLALALPASAFALGDGKVERQAGRLAVTWSGDGPVDVFVADRADATVKTARRVSTADRDGRFELPEPATVRRYFLLRDIRTGKLRRVAEREIPLERGSNFRDLGGYSVAGGKTIKWGKIFRSGAMPMLSEGDYAQLEALKIGSIIDLRSVEEREVAPTGLDDRTGALFLSNDYSLKPMMANFASQAASSKPMYAGMEDMLKPQFRLVFNRLLADQGATLYNCSAGQDRTGITSALVLSALGVDRATILKDYHLSTALRRPANEMPPVDPADYPGNPIVGYYAAAAKKPGGAKAEPLYAKDGTSLLVQFFAYLDTRYGGVDGYLAKELGIGPAQKARLRLAYTE